MPGQTNSVTLNRDTWLEYFTTLDETSLKNLIDQFIEKYGINHALLRLGQFPDGDLLNTASRSAPVSIVKYLVAKGAKVHGNDEVASYYVRPLLGAVQETKLQNVQFLLTSYQDDNLDEILLDAYYSLMLPTLESEQHNKSIIKALVAAGATYNDDFSEDQKEEIRTVQQQILLEDGSLILKNNRLISYADALYQKVDDLMLTLDPKDFGPEFTIDPETEISEKMLSTLVEKLVKKEDGVAFLTCGLLLEDRIASEIPERYKSLIDGTQDQIEYVENCTHAAVGYYLKARQDERTKEIANSMLWHLRTTTEIPSLQKHLEQISIPVPQFVLEMSGNMQHKDTREAVAPLPKSIVSSSPYRLFSSLNTDETQDHLSPIMVNPIKQ